MLELLGINPSRTGELLGLFGTTQAALHELPCGAACAEGIIPVVTSAVDVLAADTRVEDRYGRELSWLADHQPEPAAPVLCHGRYQPGIATGDPECGEPVVVRDWSGAVLAEPEYDVAYTVMAFWAAPFYTATRSERAGMKMIRDMITNVYRGSYEGQHETDADRVRFWQVFHGVRESVDPAVPDDLVPALKKHLKRLAS
jgi:aminoglycoside phosphotransferase (APT) family kinase protein